MEDQGEDPHPHCEGQRRHQEESKHQVPVKGLSLDVEDDGGDKVHANQFLEVTGVPTRIGKCWKERICQTGQN